MLSNSSTATRRFATSSFTTRTSSLLWRQSLFTKSCGSVLPTTNYYFYNNTKNQRYQSFHSSVASLGETIVNSTESIPSSDKKFEKYIAFHDVTVSDILVHKERYGNAPLVVKENESVYATAHKMAAEWNVGAVLVQEQNSEEIVGIFTERDFLRKIAEYPVTVIDANSNTMKSQTNMKDWRTVPVKQFMTRNFIAVQESTSCLDCMKLMTERRFRRLPVKNDRGKIVGLVSLGDLVNTVIKEYRNTLGYYLEYLNGNYSAPLKITNAENQEPKPKSSLYPPPNTTPDTDVRPIVRPAKIKDRP
jgi:CBS domain-containing protein